MPTCHSAALPSRRRAAQKLPALVVALLVPCAVSPASFPAHRPSTQAPGDSGERLEASLTALREAHVLPGITAVVILPDGQVVSAAVGLADVEAGERMTSDHVMPAGSIGKSFAAATVLALVQEGVLRLDVPVSEWLGDRPWFEELPNADELTLRRLLNHSSGITGDYIMQMEEAFAYSLDRFGGKDLAEQGVTHDDFAWAITADTAAFPAGDGYGYSDANYILVALTIEAVTGNAYYDEVAARFLGPLSLATIVPTARHLDNLAPGYEPDEVRLSVFPPKFAEGGRLILDPAIEWAGGGFAATSSDLARWAKILYGGDAIAARYVDEMIDSANPHVPNDSAFRYGLGVQVVESETFGIRLQHGGYFFGYSSFMEYLPRHDAALAFQTNTKKGYQEYRLWADRLWSDVGLAESVGS